MTRKLWCSGEEKVCNVKFLLCAHPRMVSCKPHALLLIIFCLRKLYQIIEFSPIESRILRKNYLTVEEKLSLPLLKIL